MDDCGHPAHDVAKKSRVPPAPASFDQARLFADVAWHQHWEIFEGVFLPGRNPVDVLLNRANVPFDLSGKRVLDVGAWNGAFSFECERRGAEVVACSPEGPRITGFDRLKEVLGSKVEFLTGSVYDLDPAVLGTFDIVIFFGVLYHLRYPLLAIDKLRRVCTGETFVETHVIDEWLVAENTHWLGPPIVADPNLFDIPLWRFYRGAVLGNDPSNCFGPNIRAVLDAFGSAGFTIELTSKCADRAAFRATVAPIVELAGTYEGELEVIQKSVGLKWTPSAGPVGGVR